MIAKLTNNTIGIYLTDDCPAVDADPSSPDFILSADESADLIDRLDSTDRLLLVCGVAVDVLENCLV